MAVSAHHVLRGEGLPFGWTVDSGPRENMAGGLGTGSGLSPWVEAVCSNSTRGSLAASKLSLLAGLMAGGILLLPEGMGEMGAGEAGPVARAHEAGR